MDRWDRLNAPHYGYARILLVGGPFDGEEAAFVPPDLAAPAQIVWGGWFPWGFSAYLYEWRGEVMTDRGRTSALVYRPLGQRLTADEIPPLIGEDVEVWADGADLLVRLLTPIRGGRRWGEL
jgi:hypothetical protein